MRSPRAAIRERLRGRLSASLCQVDIAARLQVWLRGADGEPYPAEILPRLYGGRYDPAIGGYTGEEPERVELIKCHPGQVPFLTHQGSEMRLLALGAPGGGKSYAAERAAALLALANPHGRIGVVAPVSARKRILWDDLIELLQPLGWLARIAKADEELHLVNGCKLQFVAAKEQSRSTGSPTQGYTWNGAVEDEHQNMTNAACVEVNLRGRLAGDDYRVFSTATNQLIPEFQSRLDEWYRRPEAEGICKVVRFSGEDNVFVASSWWAKQRHFLSAADYSRLIGGEDEIQGIVNHAFSNENLRRVPDIRTDVTAALTKERYGTGYPYVIAYDPGSQTNSCKVLKAFHDPGPFHVPPLRDELQVLWFIVDELVTKNKTTTEHALELLKHRGGKYKRGEIVWVIDPHAEGRETDKSDKRQLERLGFEAHWASVDKIPIKHRQQMVNALWCDGYGHRRLFFATDEHGHPYAPEGVKAVKLYRHEDVGKKGPHDLSHFYDDLGYGLFPFEKIRGNPGGREAARAASDPLMRKLAARADRRN